MAIVHWVSDHYRDFTTHLRERLDEFIAFAKQSTKPSKHDLVAYMEKMVGRKIEKGTYQSIYSIVFDKESCPEPIIPKDWKTATFFSLNDVFFPHSRPPPIFFPCSPLYLLPPPYLLSFLSLVSSPPSPLSQPFSFPSPLPSFLFDSSIPFSLHCSLLPLKYHSRNASSSHPLFPIPFSLHSCFLHFPGML